MSTLEHAPAPDLASPNSPPVALFASRDLALIWLPPGWHSPSLHRTGSHLAWFWQCDPVFLSWMSGVLAKNRARVTPAMQKAADFVGTFVCSRHNITDDDRSAMLPPGAALPDELLTASVGLYDADCGPAWAGMARQAAKAGVEIGRELPAN